MSKTGSLLKHLIRCIGKYNYIDAHKTEQPAVHTHLNREHNIHNRDMLPVGISFVGNYEKKEYQCTISKNGMYVVNNQCYGSLSEAAKSVTGVRTEGWRFWKLYIKGPSILDIFRKETTTNEHA